MILRFARALGSRAAALTPVRFMGLVLLSRLLLLAALWTATHGHEISSDVSMHMGMVREPLSVLLYTHPDYEQNPPFLPFLETVIGYPLHFGLPDFLTLRLVMISYETMLAGLFYQLLRQLRVGQWQRGLCLTAFIVLPMGWMTSVVMAQDEVIAAVAFAVPMLVFISGRRNAALLLCGVGVIAGKLFIGVELLVFIALCGRRRLPQNLLLGFAPIVLAYGAMTVHRLVHGLPLPLLGFRPDPIYGANFWELVRKYAGVNLSAVGPLSGILALSASLIPVVVVYSNRTRPRSGEPDAMTIAIAANTALLIFLTLFYHVNAEYFIMIMPVLLATAGGLTDAICCILISAIPWAGKFFENATFMATRPAFMAAHADLNSGKALVFQRYMTVFHSQPGYWLAGCQLALSILTVLICIRQCLRLATVRLPAAAAPDRLLDEETSERA